MSSNHIFSIVFLIIFLLSGETFSAEVPEPDWDRWRLHGFFSQSYIKTDNNNFFGNSEEGSFKFYEAGLNTRWQALPNLSFSMQVLSRDAGAFDDGRLRVDYGFLDWQITSSENYQLGVRLGRTLNPVGLYNDTRDVATTRPSIFLPQSIYHDKNRNLLLSSDGGQIYQEWFGDSYSVALNFAVIRPRLEDPGLEEQLVAGGENDRFSKRTGWLSRLLYDYDFGLVRLGITVGDFRLSYDGDVFSIPIEDARFNNKPLVLSAQYNGSKFEVSGEYNFRKSIYSSFDGFPLYNTEVDSYGYYLQSSYIVNDKWKVFTRFDANVANSDDPRGVDLARATGDPNHHFFANDLSFGLRWDVDSNWMLSAEIHAIEGTLFTSDLENGPRSERRKNWHLFSGLVSFRF